MKRQPNLVNFLRHAEGFNDRLQQSLINFKNQNTVNTSTIIIKPLTLLLCAIFLISCNNDDSGTQLKTYYTHYWESRHDAIPDLMQGEWASVSNTDEIILIVNESFVMGENFTISPQQDNAVNSKNTLYTMYQNGSVYTLSFGSGDYAKYLTLTKDNKCVARLKRFQNPAVPEPAPVNSLN